MSKLHKCIKMRVELLVYELYLQMGPSGCDPKGHVHSLCLCHKADLARELLKRGNGYTSSLSTLPSLSLFFKKSYKIPQTIF